mmetsp:Transcript_1793/g.4187  ORF Transcript_1793/g.4187 Transcript_1793/m.4187 type:complete len:211 (-) Transcript_1793:37-669(-)
MMFIQTILALSAIAQVAAFSGLPLSRAPSSSGLKMSAEDMVGSLAPVGFFDPLGLSAGKPAGELKKYREAELKHGRVAMTAFLGILVGESFNPFFDGKITGPAIYQFQQADAILPLFWVGVTWFIAMIEGQTIISAWQPLQETMNEPLGLAKLSKTHVAGDLRFDPLNLKPRTDKDLRAMRTKEVRARLYSIRLYSIRLYSIRYLALWLD